MEIRGKGTFRIADGWEPSVTAVLFLKATEVSRGRLTLLDPSNPGTNLKTLGLFQVKGFESRRDTFVVSQTRRFLRLPRSPKWINGVYKVRFFKNSRILRRRHQRICWTHEMKQTSSPKRKTKRWFQSWRLSVFPGHKRDQHRSSATLLTRSLKPLALLDSKEIRIKKGMESSQRHGTSE